MATPKPKKAYLTKWFFIFQKILLLYLVPSYLGVKLNNWLTFSHHLVVLRCPLSETKV